MSGRCLKGVWKVSGGCLEGVCKVSGLCLLDGIWTVSGRCLRSVWRVSLKVTGTGQAGNGKVSQCLVSKGQVYNDLKKTFNKKLTNPNCIMSW